MGTSLSRCHAGALTLVSQKPTVQGLPLRRKRNWSLASTYGTQRSCSSRQHTLQELSVSVRNPQAPSLAQKTPNWADVPGLATFLPSFPMGRAGTGKAPSFGHPNAKLKQMPRLGYWVTQQDQALRADAPTPQELAAGEEIPFVGGHVCPEVIWQLLTIREQPRASLLPACG